MVKELGHFIAGRHTHGKSGVFHDIYNPAEGKVIAKVAFANPAEVEEAVTTASTAFSSWSLTTPLRRSRILFKLKFLLEQHQEKLAQIVSEEHGKILEDARGSVARGIELVEYACGIPNLLQGTYSENVGTRVDSYTVLQPLGVCVGVSPFNFPVMVPLWMAIPAIACGNTFILKPSEKDPSAPLLLADLMKEAGLPDGVFNILNGDKEVVEFLLHHKAVKAVTAVGSTPVAKQIYMTAIAEGKRSHTFGGAKNHCVVMPDANLVEAADGIVGAAYGSAGERCMAISAVIVIGDETADRFIEHLQAKIHELKMGPGNEPSSEMGPLVTQDHLQRVVRYIEQGVAEGASLLVDGRKDPQLKQLRAGFYLGPTLFDHVLPTMQIYQEEIFGPVLVVLRVRDFEEAVQLVSRHRYGNGTAIYTQDGRFAREFASRVQVGMVGINVPIPVPVAYHSFGGWKESMYGDVGMHGDQSVQFYTQKKTVTLRWSAGEASKTSSFVMPKH